MKIQALQYEKLRLVLVEKPDENVGEVLAKYWDFHHLDVEDVLSPVQRPKVDLYRSYIFMILLYPILNREEIKASELDIFMTDDTLIIIHDGRVKPLNSIFQRLQKDPRRLNRYFNRGTAFLLYRIMQQLYQNVLTLTDQLAMELSEIEDKIFKGEERKIVRSLFILKRKIVDLKRMVRPTVSAIRKLSRTDHPLISRDVEKYYENLEEEINEVWNLVQNSSDTVDSIQGTNEALIDHKLSTFTTILAIVAAVGIPISVIANFYADGSMVAPMPPFLFWIIVGGLSLFIFGLFIYFKIRKYF